MRCDVSNCNAEGEFLYDGLPFCYDHMKNCHRCHTELVGSDEYGWDCPKCRHCGDIAPFIKAMQEDKNRGSV